MDFIDKYFEGEKIQSISFIVVGTIGIVFCIYCWFVNRKKFWRALAWPVIIFSIIQVNVGILIHYRTPDDIERVKNMKVLEPTRIITEEIPRMEKVISQFNIYYYLELAMVIAGLVILTTKRQAYLRGIGLGLLIEGAVLLLADGIAGERALEYFEQLQKIASPLRERS